MGEKFKAKHPKVAEFIEKKAPNLLNAVGGILPENGALGVIKNLITSDASLDAADKLELQKLLIEAQENELQDIANARNREIQIATSDKAPLLNKIIQPLLAILILGSCFLFWYMMLYTEIPKEKEVMVAGVTGSLTTLSMGVVTYYFGSSSSSAAKQKQLEKMIKN